MTAFVGQEELFVGVDGHLVTLAEESSVEALAELLWAPDSAAFALTESDGGNVGTWSVVLYVFQRQSASRVNLGKTIVDAFRKRYQCDSAEEPNVGAVAWVEGSRRLLVVAEVPPHSSCQEMGAIRGYEVEIPSGRIAAEVSESELRLKWSNLLGQRLVRE